LQSAARASRRRTAGSRFARRFRRAGARIRARARAPEALMHEMSIAMEVCRIAEDKLGSSCGDLVGLGLEVGTDAGVEIDNLQFCLEVLLTQPPFRSATLEISRLPGDVLRLSYLEVDDGSPDA
jgi:hypothetical protein